jgi:extradiol dioxygenase family protein
MNLGAARVSVRDFAEAKAFYSQRLGLTIEAADEELILPRFLGHPDKRFNIAI